MGTKTETETEFSVHHFEKQLTTLKDSQDAINTCCQWCLQNRVHHKKIVSSWLNVLKRVKVEQRLILFYLANDVVQYSKRKNYEYVESWGTALQKATTMVRDEKVKHKILRIFKIWEQRNVYNEEFISDLCGLLSVQPVAPKADEPHEFQSNYVINKIKSCSKLESDTDAKLKVLKEHNPKIVIDDGLIGSLKDRAHVDDVEKEVEVYVNHMEDYINALKLEIRTRINLISVLKQAENQLEADRKDVKVVVNAYKMFGTRVKTFQRKLDEHRSTLSSPAPSPDINAPSPDSETDIELPEMSATEITPPPKEINIIYDPKAELEQQQQQQYNAGFYNSIQSDNENMGNSFLSNGFSSFIGSDLSFSLDNLHPSIFETTLNTTASNTSTTSYTPTAVESDPLPVAAPTEVRSVPSGYSYNTSNHQLPLLPPPPMPSLFGKPDSDYDSFGHDCSNNADSTTYADNSFLAPSTTSSLYAPFTPGLTTTATTAPFLDDSYEPPAGANPYPPAEEYNPEDEVSSWEPHESNWERPPIELDTPESPPMFEKEGYSDPVEYHDGAVSGNGASDVDHRVIPGLGDDMVLISDDSLCSLGGKDVDHRNLISLTGSPGNSNSNNAAAEVNWNSQALDRDYRILPPSNLSSASDQDYRVGFNLEQLKLPPPPPPPSKFQVPVFNQTEVDEDCRSNSLATNSHSRSPRKSDNIDSIDMDMDVSDEDTPSKQNDNLRVILEPSHKNQQQFSLEPPPPLPDLPDDVDANNFLDDLNNDLHEFSNLSDELNNSSHGFDDSKDFRDSGMKNTPLRPPLLPDFNAWSQPPPRPMNIGNMIEPPPMMPLMNTPPPNNMGMMGMPLHDMNLPMPGPMMPPPQPGQGLWPEDEQDEDEGWNMQEDDSAMAPPPWVGSPHPNKGVFGFRGRGNRGNFTPWRGRGRPFIRGGNNFRGSPRGGNWTPRPRGHFRGNFRGGF